MVLFESRERHQPQLRERTLQEADIQLPNQPISSIAIRNQ